tara:strand:+ start:1425 stop:1823 length:399 start_codon:yes stop_codon:yes gene_type:complete
MYENYFYIKKIIELMIMEEYYPKYLKHINNNICNKCNNKINVEKIITNSYLNECKKCQNMGTYGYTDDYYKEYGIMPRSIYENCSCKTEYIYKKIIKCMNCCKCEQCSQEFTYEELDNINNIEDKHLCKNCI